MHRSYLIIISEETINKRSQVCSLCQASGKGKEEGNILGGNVFCLQTFFVFFEKAKVKLELIFERFILGFIFLKALRPALTIRF